MTDELMPVMDLLAKVTIALDLSYVYDWRSLLAAMVTFAMDLPAAMSFCLLGWSDPKFEWTIVPVAKEYLVQSMDL